MFLKKVSIVLDYKIKWDYILVKKGEIKMPDNDDLRNRLVALEQQLGLTTRNDNHIQANTDTNVSANINWRALYKWLESEVEEMIFDPNAPQYLKDWGTKILSEARSKLNL